MNQIKQADNTREGKKKVPHNRHPGGSFGLKRLKHRRKRRWDKRFLSAWRQV